MPETTVTNPAAPITATAVVFGLDSTTVVESTASSDNSSGRPVTTELSWEPTTVVVPLYRSLPDDHVVIRVPNPGVAITDDPETGHQVLLIEGRAGHLRTVLTEALADLDQAERHLADDRGLDPEP